MKYGLPIEIDLPEGFLEKEVRCGYEVSSEMKKVWAVELDLLNQFDKICKGNGIKYFAHGGTLLGAVRHGGYIPWDDDIDIAMFRDDYDRFMRIAPGLFKAPYFLQTIYTDSRYNMPFAKIRNRLTTGITEWDVQNHRRCCLGIWIDIFSLDGVGDDKMISWQECECGKLFRLMNRRLRPINRKSICLVKDLILKFLCLWQMNHKKVDLRFREIFRMQPVDSSRFVGLLNFRLKEKRFWTPREWFGEIIEMPFENLKIPVPKMYEEVLRKAYGEWRKFVRGAACHNHTFFDCGSSSEKYKDLNSLKLS